MMAPGIPEIAIKYGITDSTTIALTLSIFVLSYALGVSSRSPFYLNHCDTSDLSLSRSLWSLPPSPRCTEGHGYVLLQLITSVHHVAHFPFRSSISAICLRWHSVWDVRSPQIQTLSLVSVFSVSIQQGCFLFECSAGSSRIFSKCIHRMHWRFYHRFICSSRTSICYVVVHSWIPCWYESLFNLILFQEFLILFLGPAVGPIAGGFIVQTIGIKWVFLTIASLYSSTSSWLGF